MHHRQIVLSSSIEHALGRCHRALEAGGVVTKQLAEAAWQQEVALHVDDQQRGTGRCELKWTRNGRARGLAYEWIGHAVSVCSALTADPWAGCTSFGVRVWQAFVLPRAKLEHRVRGLSERYGFQLEPHAGVGSPSIGQQ
jgi:hypothetical protein